MPFVSSLRTGVSVALQHACVRVVLASQRLLAALFDKLDIRLLIRVASTSRLAEGLVSTYFGRRLRRFLSLFLADPDAFLSEMDATGAVLSGSFTLPVLLRHDWMPGDLDIYAPVGTWARVVAYLVNSEDYTVDVPSISSPAYGSYSHIRAVARLSRPDGQRIDVVQSHSMSPLTPIAHFWMSAVMNYITPTHFCIAYRDMTCAGRALLAPSRFGGPSATELTGAEADLMRKYERRGIQFYLSAPADAAYTCREGGNSPACASTKRFFGDHHSLIGKIHSTDTSARVDDDPYAVVWWRGGYGCGGRCKAGDGWRDPTVLTIL
ncbi:hypothetical protein FKP32DRAFT_1569389 [Trametes sanguinea]|nr:hypothetical protein FKP32DRAFT_1569389 [Trametes sanguinea]